MKYNWKEMARNTAVKMEKLRKEFGDSPAEMAERLGLQPTGYYKYERADAVPGMRTLYRLVHEFGISADWLLFGKGPRNVDDRSRIGDLKNRVQQLETALEKERAALREMEEENRESIKMTETFEETGIAELLERIKNTDVTVDTMNKPGVVELLERIEKNRTFYHKIMLYIAENLPEKDMKKEKNWPRTDTD